jgi:hypothetical protein
VSQLSTRLKAYLPGGGASGLYGADETADIDKINDNFKLVDAAIGLPRYDSNARPATPFTGQAIHNSNYDGRIEFYTGSKWMVPAAFVGSLGALEAGAIAGLFALGSIVVVNNDQTLTTGVLRQGSAWVMGANGHFTPLAGVPLVVSTDVTMSELATAVGSTYTRIDLLTRLTKVFSQQSNITFLYVGAGLTNLRANAPTAAWQAWSKEALTFNPTIFSGINAGSSTSYGSWQIVEGRTFFDYWYTAGASFAFVNAELEYVLGTTQAVLGQFSIGTGIYQPAGSSGNGIVVPFQAYTAGVNAGLSATRVRVRVPRVNSATSPQNPVLSWPFSSLGAGSTTDSFGWSLSGPSAMVA